jgi:two-component system sensor histidine kinase FlrB
MSESTPSQSPPSENSADARERALADAFAAFNKLSEDLAKSYRELELRVEQLSEELAAARSERLVQLAEKERLANRLSQLLEALPGAVIVTDAEGVVHEANPAALEFMGKPLLGERWVDVAKTRFVGGVAEGGEVRLTDGRRLSFTARALGSEPGQILLLQDVTEARTLQEQLDRHRRLAAMGEMVAGLAHQIRTPLSSVLLYLSHLERKRLDDRQRERVVERIRGRVLHLEGMVGDMLQFARGGTAELVPCRLDALVSEFEELVAVSLAERAASLEVSWESEELREASVSCQRAPLAGALLNLATNALRAGGQDVRLWLQIWRPRPDSIALSLEDSGPGIDAEIAERIFEPFFTTDTQGTGLGLPVVRAVMDAHGGEVVLEPPSKLRGARFSLRLPAGTSGTDERASGADG